MNTNRRSLEQLIPAVYRTRDAERNGPLSELLQVLSEQVRIVDSNIEQLYNDLFVETCQPWVVPYHGELVGLQPTATPPSSRARLSQTLLNPRREVADAIHFEGRKGTLAVLEEIAAATANWPARAVEYYAQVSTFQSSHHPDPAMAGTVRVTGNTDELNQIGTPFNSAPHLIDARVTAQGSVRTFDNRGLFHPSHIGLQIWRLGLYQLSLAETRCVCARSVATDDGEKELRVHTFDSFGLESQLAIKPVPESDETLIAGERNVPGALSLRAFSEGNDGASSDYYGRDKSVGIWVQVGANGIEFVRTEQIVAMDLAWLLETCCGGADEDGPSSCTQRRKDLVERLSPRNAEADQDELETQNLAFAVDPEHGLIAFAGKQELLEKLTIKPTFHHNFSADVGGGQYDRSSRTNAYRTNTVVQRVRDRVRTGTPAEQTLANQIECLDDDGIVSTEHAVVELASNEIFDLGIEEVTILNGCHLEIRSAKNRRPTVDLCNKTACDPALIVHLGKHARLTIEGIRLFGGKIVVRDYDSGDTVLNPSDDCEQPNATQTTRFSVSHSSLLPNPIREANGCKGSQSVSIDFQVPNGQLVVDHSIVGPIHVNGDPKNLPSLVSIKDSVVDGRASDNHAIVGVHAAILRVQRSTVVGRTRVREMELASDSIFTLPVEVERRQVGGMRFCYVPQNSLQSEKPRWSTPQQYYCQPSQTFERQDRRTSCGEDPTASNQIEWMRIKPVFNSIEFGDPGYCQLSLDCPVEIREGAEDGSEMGVFHDLFQPQRTVALSRRVSEFTPLSLQTSIIFVN